MAMMLTLKRRLAALEAAIGDGSDVPATIILDVVDALPGAPPADFENNCLGLEAKHRGAVHRLTREPGESLARLDARAAAYRVADQGESVLVWFRVCREFEYDRAALLAAVRNGQQASWRDFPGG